MAKPVVLLCLFLATSSLCSGKNGTLPKQDEKSTAEEEFSEKSDKRDKRQILKDIFTLYGGWKPILPGSPYYFGSQAFSGGLGGFSYQSPEYGGTPSSSFLGQPSFYIQAPIADFRRKNIYSYYPPPVIGSSYGRDYYPKPLYKERIHNRNKGSLSQIVPYPLDKIATIDIRDAAKNLEVVDLRVSVLPLGRGNLKHPINQHLPENTAKLHFTTVPIVPQLENARPLTIPHQRPLLQRPLAQTIPEKVPIILPTVPVHPKQLPRFQTIDSLPHRLKHNELVLTTHPLRPQVQEFYPPQLPSRPNNYRPEKQQDIVVTVVSDNVDTTIHKRPDGSKEEIKVVPIQIPDGTLQPAAVVDEVIEIKNIPIDIVDATVTSGGKEKYSSSNKRPSVQYLSLSEDQINKFIQSSGIPIETELIYSAAENRGVLSSSRLMNPSSDKYKQEQFVSLNVKPGQSVEDALLQLATESKKGGSQSEKMTIDPSYETLEVINIPETDYIFSKRSESVVQRTTSSSQNSTTKPTQRSTTVSVW